MPSSDTLDLSIPQVVYSVVREWAGSEAAQEYGATQPASEWLSSSARLTTVFVIAAVGSCAQPRPGEKRLSE